MPEGEIEKRCRIVKVGGSLFGHKRLVDLLTDWLNSHNDVPNVLMCGGGPLVESLRNWSRDHRIDDETAHWSAIRMMDESTRLLASRFPDIPCCEPAALPLIIPDGNCFWLTSALFQAHSCLPPNWDVTSDSLAAELAGWAAASELCLLKSVLPETPYVNDWVDCGIVDPLFFKTSKTCAKITMFDLVEGRSLIAAR